MTSNFYESVSQAPLIPILRGISPAEIIGVAQHLIDSGVKILEIPLNSPDPLKSIEKLRNKFGNQILIGAGTVLTTDDVINVKNAGAEIILSPNCNSQVVNLAITKKLTVIPGIATPTEYFIAYSLGVRNFKVFPFEILGIKFIQALKAVAQPESRFIPVGGVAVTDISGLVESGCLAVGIGSSLYSSNMTNEEFLKNCSLLKMELEKVAHLTTTEKSRDIQ